MTATPDRQPDTPPDTPRSDAPGRSQAPRHRLDEVFGEVLPETTADEREPGQDGGDPDTWYLENRPPHHER